MFTHKKSPLSKNAKQNSVDPGFPGYSSPNPFDSDDESGTKKSLNPAQRSNSEPTLVNSHLGTHSSDNDERNRNSSSSYSLTYSSRNRYKNDFRDAGGLENQNVQELENYAVYKAEETTTTVKSCLKIAEDMREDATRTLANLHQQGEQITRSHMVAADLDHDLSRGEKLLGSLGGIFSKTWKPTRTRHIKGPVMTRDEPAQRRGDQLEQREKLGLTTAPKGRSNTRTPPPEPATALQKVEVEKAKQDDGLSDLSNLLEELKYMAVDMGSEIDRQSPALDRMMGDVDELNSRVKGANQRGRRLLGK
ncbi:SNAP25 homologous protein SNAP33-like [Rhododendron vialii]|uniref:SNAP25 homologous protein SNAP33-like n=1 Tax=Rhododendron vialii TaxID=182163 RepID=UPI00265FE001|nr:SNAP25 homologous protein SNAP33-like [Rhododendron vialii]